MNWDTKLTELVERISEQHDLSPEEGKKMVDYTFSMLRKCMSMAEIPKIYFIGLGTFKVAPSRIEKELGYLDSRLRKGKLSQEDYNKRKHQLESVLKRRLKEDAQIRRTKPNVQS